MTAEQLRNSILQEAISGRLVPQDPNDEPASVLLQRIREEKAQLVKEGKLKKKDLLETPITEDEKPFEIPASWEWCRVQQVIKVKSGDGLNVRSLNDKAQYPVYGGNGINGTYHQYNVEADTLVIGRVGFYCGAVHKTYGKAWVTDNALIVSFVKTGIYVDFLKYVLTWLKIRRTSNSTAQPVVSGKGIYPLIFPLPPLAEQKRIVAKLEELLPIVEQYSKAQKELDELNATLPARLRQSILQEAISGRLIPQDENETADGLKEHLLQAVNNSPFKKKWNSELIEDEELPFDIPDNWRWIRLGDIVYTLTGLSYSKGDLEKKVSNPIRVLRGGNIQSGSWCTKDDDVMIAPEFVKKDIFLKKNSFITPAVTSLEHLGKTALIREDHNDIVAGGFVLYLMPYDDRNDGLMEYLAYFFQSAFYNSFCKTITNKSGQAFWNISREKLLKLPIPLPPLAEQQRIVAKIESLFTEIDKLK